MKSRPLSTKTVFLVQTTDRNKVALDIVRQLALSRRSPAAAGRRRIGELSEGGLACLQRHSFTVGGSRHGLLSRRSFAEEDGDGGRSSTMSAAMILGREAGAVLEQFSQC
jgi:hypothetical protein